MPSSVPTPLAAALGLVPAVLDGVRTLPARAVSRAVQLPVLAVSSALSTLEVTRQGYDDLAERGERLIARLRGVSFDEVEDRVEEALEGTPVAGFYDAVEDAAEDLTEGAGAALRSVTGTASRAVRTAGAEATNGATAAPRVATPVQEELPAAEQPKDAPTPKATQPDSTRVDTAATASVQQTVEAVAAGVEVPDHDALPLPDYDHMTLGSLRGRLRSLTVEQLVQVRAYEKAKADRLPVVTMLDNRIAKLTTDASTQPTGNTHPDPAGKQPAQTGSLVSPATSGPKVNSPNGGDPTNPAQPRSSGTGSAQPATSS